MRIPERWRSLAARRCREVLPEPIPGDIVTTVALLYWELDTLMKTQHKEDNP